LSKISGDESPQFFSVPERKEEEAALDRAAKFTGSLLEAAPWLWPELSDSEPAWPSSPGSTRSSSHLYSSHGCRTQAVLACAAQSIGQVEEMNDSVKFSHPVAVCFL